MRKMMKMMIPIPSETSTTIHLRTSIGQDD